MKKMKRQPTHPGTILKEDYLVPLEITITDMAAMLGISRTTLSKILNGKGGISPEMALRLSRAFGTTPDLWLNLQKNYDLWNAARNSSSWKSVKPIPGHVMQSELQTGT